MKRQLLAVILGTSLLAGGCSSVGDKILDKSIFNQALSRDQENPEVWGTWSPPQPGSYDPSSMASGQLFRPCEEIPADVEQELGIHLHRDEESDPGVFNCEFDLRGFESSQWEFYFGSIPGTLAEQHAVESWNLIRRLPNFPEAVAMQQTREQFNNKNCSAAVETPRGVIEILAVNFNGYEYGFWPCERIEDTLTKLYKGRDYAIHDSPFPPLIAS